MDNNNLEEQPTTEPEEGKKKRGRPPGRKNRYTMQNGHITEDQIHLYTPENTIPVEHRSRFLELCDKMINVLDARTVTDPEVEEIAQYYRDRLVLDEIYKSIADPHVGIAADTTLIRHLDNLSKQLERRKENLQIRAKDRANARDLTRQKTMMDLLGEVNESSIKNLIEDQKKVLQDYYETDHTDPMQYMEERAPKGYVPVEEGGD